MPVSETVPWPTACSMVTSKPRYMMYLGSMPLFMVMRSPNAEFQRGLIELRTANPARYGGTAWSAASETTRHPGPVPGLRQPHAIGLFQRTGHPVRIVAGEWKDRR